MQKQNRMIVHLMFKVLQLQRYLGLGDKQVQFQITDRISFNDFFGLSAGVEVPNENTIWLFHVRITKTEQVEALFGLFII